MEEKLAVPAAQALPESEAATIAATSVVGDEKSDVEAVPAADTTAGEPEKTEELARQATAASKTGQSIRPTATREDGTEYPSGMKLGLITLALCLSVFLMALDNSIIATAIPEITNEFTSLPDVGWYGSGTFLAHNSSNTGPADQT
jgi:hypothetical protein